MKEIIFSSDFNRTKKKYIKNSSLNQEILEELIAIFKENPQKLEYKHIKCKKDKNRYSIRVFNTGFRILLSSLPNSFVFRCICNHNEYDRRNRRC
jgi:hypothetical protein